MNQHACSFRGASGADYGYYVFSPNFKPDDNRFYNYLFASLSAEGGWIPLFIGQGDLQQYLSDQAHVQEVALNGATHVLAHVSPHEQQRRMEALDMLASHPQAHAFSGCNVGSLASAALLSAPKTGGGTSPVNKSSKRSFPKDQTFKNHSPSLQSLDSVWTRLRAKIRG